MFLDERVSFYLLLFRFKPAFFIIGVNLTLKKGLIATKFLGAEYLALTWLIFVAYFTNDERMLAHPHFSAYLPHLFI